MTRCSGLRRIENLITAWKSLHHTVIICSGDSGANAISFRSLVLVFMIFNYLNPGVPGSTA